MKNAATPYVNLTRAKFDQLQCVVRETISSPPELVIEVEKGMQRGSIAILEQESIVIGDELPDDLFIRATTDTSDKISLKSQKSLVGALVEIETSRTDVLVNEQAVDGHFGPVRLPIVLDYADVSLSIISSTDLDHEEKTDTFLKSIVAVLGVLALVFMLFAFGQRSGPEISTVPKQANSASLGAITKAVTSAEEMINSAGFGSNITVTTTADDTIVVEGQLSSGVSNKWPALREQLDTVIGGNTVVENVQIRPTLGNVPAIASIVIGENGQIILRNGRKLRVGDILTGEWKIAEIGGSEMSLTNGEDVVALKY